jgi:phage repressor protein C with HTH and peptisase S24 domain
MSEVLRAQLRAAAARVGGNKRLAELSGIPLSTFNDYLERGDLPISRALQIAKAAGVSIDWLCPVTPGAIAEESANYEASGPVPAGYTLLPRYDVRAAAGAGAAVLSERIVDHLAFKTSWIVDEMGLNPRSLFLIMVVGDSMIPTLKNGDLALVDRGDPRFRDNAIYAIEVGGDLIVKRVQRRVDGRVVILSDNPVYKPDELSPEAAEGVNVIGRLVWAGGRL